MALLDNSEASRALLNEAMKKFTRSIFDSGTLLNQLMARDRWPHYVHYHSKYSRVNYCPPDTFGFIGERGLTDCDWAVPGTF